MGYFIAANCVSLGPMNCCKHPLHRRPWWTKWLLGPRPGCVYMRKFVAPRADTVVCKEQVEWPRPVPPQSFRVEKT